MATNIFRLQAVTWEQSPLHTALYGNTRNRQEGAEMTVDWGDGTVQTNQDITPMHETAKGVYTVTLTYNDKITYYIDGTVIYPTQVLSLVEAVLDESTVIEGNAFRGCWYLTKLTLGATTPPVLGEYAFEGANNLTAIYVPLSAVNAYKTAWADFADKIRGYFPMKTVAAGAHYTTVTVDTAEAVKFSFPSTSLSVEASGGDITVALTETAQAGDDETITVPDGESRMFIHHRPNIDTYYLTGSGKATLYASNTENINPFKGKSKGGDGGGTLGLEEVVLWENTGITAPDTITLSEALTNFDELIVVPKLHNTTGTVFDGAMSMTYRVADIAQGENITFMQDLPSNYCTYWYTSPTVFTKHDVSGWYPFKIIGRRYTRVNPSGYRETLLYDNAEMTPAVVDQNIELSPSVENFDKLLFEIAFLGGTQQDTLYYQVWGKPVSLLGVGTNKYVALSIDRNTTRSTFITVTFNTSSSATIVSIGADTPILSKIIGIKY